MRCKVDVTDWPARGAEGWGFRNPRGPGEARGHEAHRVGSAGELFGRVLVRHGQGVVRLLSNDPPHLPAFLPGRDRPLAPVLKSSKQLPKACATWSLCEGRCLLCPDLPVHLDSRVT